MGVLRRTWQRLDVGPMLKLRKGSRRKRVSLQFMLTNFNIRYCVSTDTTISRIVSSSRSINGILRAEELIISTQASYSERDGWIEQVSSAEEPDIEPMSAKPSSVKVSDKFVDWSGLVLA